jgi:hypothetical protein
MPLAPLRLFSGRTARSEPFVPDNYLTDGERLFRVVSQLGAGEEHGLASLEDCLTPEVHVYAPGELGAMKLRPVDVANRR